MSSETTQKALQTIRRRTVDGVALFRPAPNQEAFFRCRDSEVLLRGGNRSGKSTCVAVRFAAVARQMPITFANGDQQVMRLPHQMDRPLLMWVVGYDLRHIGQTIYRLLFRPGLYKIVRDLDTFQWRAFDPVRDKGRQDECKPSPPLIPMSEVETIAWEHKGEKQFTQVTLKNGTIICGFSSVGEVKAGDPVDEIWIDEAIEHPGHYPEWQARLSDLKGRITWSSWPKKDNPALRDISRRAKAKREHPESRDSVAEFVLRFSDNAYIDPDEKAKRIAGWSEEDRIARDQGEYALDSLKMYAAFSRQIHCAYSDDRDADDALAAILRAGNGVPPASWTRYLVLDPGTSRPGVLLAAVPPPELGDYVVCYDELYPGRVHGADALADLILAKTENQYFEAFIIDGHAARTTPMGMGVTVGSNYSRAFRERRLACRTSGSQFLPGSDDVIGRIGIVQRWMSIRGDGRTKLRVVIDRCPVLCQQLEDYEKTEQDGFIIDKPAPRQDIDVAVCLEYLASRNPMYVERPVDNHPVYSSAYRAFLRLRQERKSQQPDKMAQFGPDATVA